MNQSFFWAFVQLRQGKSVRRDSWHPEHYLIIDNTNSFTLMNITTGQEIGGYYKPVDVVDIEANDWREISVNKIGFTNVSSEIGNDFKWALEQMYVGQKTRRTSWTDSGKFACVEMIDNKLITCIGAVTVGTNRAEVKPTVLTAQDVTENDWVLFITHQIMVL